MRSHDPEADRRGVRRPHFAKEAASLNKPSAIPPILLAGVGKQSQPCTCLLSLR